MASRYWVGGSASWDATAGTKWATTSGGAGGASVPTSADDVFFDANSGAVTVTIASTANVLSLNFTGFTGTFAGSNSINIGGNLTLASGMTLTATSTLAMNASSGALSITTAGKTIPGQISIGSTGASTATFTLQDALVVTGALTVTSGTFTTNNYNVTATSISSSNTNTRTINLGSSTVTLSASGLAFNASNATGLTLNSGTSQITCTSTGPTINAGASSNTSLTFYNVSFTSNAITTAILAGTSTFNNLTVAGRTTAGISIVVVYADQTINGTLTLSAGTDATMRTFVRSDITGTTRTLTCAAVASLTDIDFRDITIAGAAAPVSGTRLGDCKGNSGITFGAPKTVYWNLATGGNWSGTGWATTGGGTPAVSNFPLAQDTAIFQSTGLNSAATVTVNASYNIGTIDMSARTSNTMTLATTTSSPTIYGNWINGTGTTLSGSGTLTFAGRGSQTITSAGKTFTQGITIDSLGGSVTLQDALTTSKGAAGSLTVSSGTFDASTYNVTLSGSAAGFASSGTSTRTVAVGSGTWTIAGSSTAWDVTVSTNLTVTGTGTLNFTSTNNRFFVGGSISYANVILNQGGAGNMQFSGSNTFKSITNTYSATGATSLTFSTNTTTTVSSFTAGGSSGKVLTINTTVVGTRATLALTGGGTVSVDYLSVKDISFTPAPATDGTTPYVWYLGANSTNSGNNVGGLFQAGGAGAIKVYQITNTATTSWTVPSDWNSSNNNIYLFGAGGGGGNSAVSGNNRAAGGGGGGGGYTAIANYSTTPAASITVAIGTSAANADGGDTTWASGAYTAGGGKKGTAATTPTSAGGAGGTGTYAGGQGGAGAFGTVASTGYGAGGGGGAGGPNGIGGAGGAGFGSTTSSNIAGGGGGGNGGGSAGGNASSATGGTGGNNFAGTGGGTGGAGASGTLGGGGAGNAWTGVGGNGGSGIDVLNTIGGAGGKGGSNNTTGAANTGLYGGGGHGGGVTTGGGLQGSGAGSQGVIIISYVPSSVVTSTGNFFLMFM